MKWIKISDQFPPQQIKILYFDGEIVDIAFCYLDDRGYGVYCNYECLATKDDHYWMLFPDQPERLSEKTPQGEATV